MKAINRFKCLQALKKGVHDDHPIALNRKNALFAYHDEGGRNWGRIASLIETCKLNNVEPYAYLKATLEAIAASHPAARIDELIAMELPKISVTGHPETTYRFLFSKGLL